MSALDPALDSHRGQRLRGFLPAGLLGLYVSALAACNPPATLEGPEPRRIAVQADVDQVLDEATRVFVASDWRVLGVEAGELRARRSALGDTNGEWLVCSNGVGATGDRRRVTRDFDSTLSARVAMIPDDRGGTAVRVAVTVIQAWSPLGPGYRPAYTTHDCVSSGAIESRIIEALAARFEVRPATGTADPESPSDHPDHEVPS